MRYHCGCCGKSVSSELPNDSIIRAFLVCPECLSAERILFRELPPDIPTRAIGRPGEITPTIQGVPTSGWSSTICTSCSGTGRVEDPQHGHDMRCERCGGSGVQTR